MAVSFFASSFAEHLVELNPPQQNNECCPLAIVKCFIFFLNAVSGFVYSEKDWPLKTFDPGLDLNIGLKLLVLHPTAPKWKWKNPLQPTNLKGTRVEPTHHCTEERAQAHAFASTQDLKFGHLYFRLNLNIRFSCSQIMKWVPHPRTDVLFQRIQLTDMVDRAQSQTK